MSERSDTEHSELAPDLGPKRPITEPPPTTRAISAAFLDLEEKMLRQLAANHEEQMLAIRGGQTELLERYQLEWSGPMARLEAAIREFGSDFSRDVYELQMFTHQNAKATHQHTLELDALTRRVLSLEKWRAYLEPKPDDEADGQDTGTG